MCSDHPQRGILSFLSKLLLVCLALVLVQSFALAEKSAPNEQRSPDSPDPRANVAFFEAEIEKFKLRMIPLLEGKSMADATAVFFEELEALYDVVGQPFKWPWANFYDLYVFGTAHSVQWELSDYYIRGLPTSSEISEEEAIAIAKSTILSLGATPAETLEMYWPRSRYYKTHPDHEYSWYVDFLIENPAETSPYCIVFALEIDPKTGRVHSYFDSRSNDL